MYKFPDIYNVVKSPYWFVRFVLCTFLILDVDPVFINRLTACIWRNLIFLSHWIVFILLLQCHCCSISINGLLRLWKSDWDDCTSLMRNKCHRSESIWFWLNCFCSGWICSPRCLFRCYISDWWSWFFCKIN